MGTKAGCGGRCSNGGRLVRAKNNKKNQRGTEGSEALSGKQEQGAERRRRVFKSEKRGRDEGKTKRERSGLTMGTAGTT